MVAFLCSVCINVTLDPAYNQNDQQSPDQAHSDLKPSLFNLSTPSQMKINNVSYIMKTTHYNVHSRLLLLFVLIMEKLILNSLLDKFQKNGTNYPLIHFSFLGMKVWLQNFSRAMVKFLSLKSLEMPKLVSQKDVHLSNLLR